MLRLEVDWVSAQAGCGHFEYDEALDRRYPTLAKLRDRRHPRALHLVGARGGSNRRWFLCHICDSEVDSEAADYPMTRHAAQNILAHLERHSLHVQAVRAARARQARIQLGAS